MAKTCYTCRHPQIKKINFRLIEGASTRSVAQQFELSDSSVYFHRVHHLPKNLEKLFAKKTESVNAEYVAHAEGLEVAKENDAFDLQERFKFLVDETTQIFEIAKAGKQSLTALKSLDSLRNTYSLLIQVLDRLEASKRLELEISKESKSTIIEQQKMEYEEQVKVLSFEELKMHHRIMEKISNQSAELLIIDGKIIGWNAPIKYETKNK